jgi:hypothetical protein
VRSLAQHCSPAVVRTRRNPRWARPSVGQPINLDDQQAYDLLNSYCEADFARGFKLYKLYPRAAAFSGHPQ